MAKNVRMTEIKTARATQDILSGPAKAIGDRRYGPVDLKRLIKEKGGAISLRYGCTDASILPAEQFAKQCEGMM